MSIKKIVAGCALAAAAVLPSAALAAEAVLKTVSGFAANSTITRTFDEFVKKVNSDPNAPVKFQVLGGPEVMPPFQLGNAVRTGVADVVVTPGAFYSAQMPEAEALKLSTYSPQELRENGNWEYIQKLYRDKMNVHYLANTNYGNKFHLYVNEPIKKPEDVKGLKLRVTPVYRDFFQSMGATVVQTPPGEVYTALERGVVDGYGWPMEGVLDLGWHEQTKYRVDPGFYTVEVGVLVNAKKWDSLTQEQRDYLTKQAAWLEDQNKTNPEVAEKERQRQEKAGIKPITFEGMDGQRWVQQAYDAGWESIIKQSPQHGPKLKELLTK